MVELHTTDIFGSCDGLLSCVAIWLNDITGGMFWTLFLVAFGIVLFMGTFQFGTPRAFAYSSISCLFGAFLLASIQLMPWSIVFMFILSALAGIGSLIVSNSRT